MFFAASKILWIFIKPLNLLLILLLLGLALRLKWKRTGAFVLSLTCILFLVLGTLPVGHNALVYLETRYERPGQLPEEVEGIIVLGGALNGALSHKHKYPVAYSTAERLHEFVRLSKDYPMADGLVSGGSGHFMHPEFSEAPYSRMFLQDMGMNVDWIEFEETSKNTYENAVFSKAQILPNHGERWILITSAFHMPRSVSIFKHIGWDVIPYPTDHKTKGEYSLMPRFDVLKNFRELELALKEYIGSFVYYHTGKSALPFPNKIVGSTTDSGDVE